MNQYNRNTSPGRNGAQPSSGIRPQGGGQASRQNPASGPRTAPGNGRTTAAQSPPNQSRSATPQAGRQVNRAGGAGSGISQAEWERSEERARLEKAQSERIRAEKMRAERIREERIRETRARAERERHKKAARIRRGAAARRSLIYMLQFVIILAIMLGITAGMIYYSLTLIKTPDASENGAGYTGAYKYTYGGEKAVSVPYETAVRSGFVYVNFKKIAQLCGFAATGSMKELKYSTSGGEYILFYTGTANVSINGENVTMPAKSVLLDDTLWIPLEFLSSCIDGLDILCKPDTGQVNIALWQNTEITFSYKSTVPLAAVSEDVFGNAPPIEFKADLSAYEKYMAPEGDAYLTLINPSNPLDSGYIPQDLINVTDTRKDGRDTQKMREYAAKALEALFIEMRANGLIDAKASGIVFSVTSAYRSYSYQNQLFKDRMALYPNLCEQDAYNLAATAVAPPGTSEHQSGLCADMHSLTAADVSFAQTPQFKWLSENAHEFGFILRFPEDKVDITGITYEPWHYRYVGRYHATRIYNSGMCLEEYVESLKK